MKDFDSDAWVKETIRLRGNTPLPTHLYKFLSLNKNKSPFGLINLQSTLLDKKLYLSSPRDFNDISDCRIQLDFSGSFEDYMKMQKDIYARHAGIRPKEAKKVLIKKNISRKEINDTLRKSTKMHVDLFGICCFTEHIRSPAQWAHYADNHSGVAIEFRWSGFSEEFPCFPVRYVKKPPMLNPIKGDYGSLYLTDGYSKSEDWSYEKEWRIIQLDSANKYFDISTDRVTSVILGVNSDPAIEIMLNEINRDLENSNRKTFKIRKARLSDSAYDITCDM